MNNRAGGSESLLRLLQWLDGLLGGAVGRGPDSTDAAAAGSFQGLCIDASTIQRLLAQKPLESSLYQPSISDELTALVAEDHLFSALQRRFSLSQFDLWVLLVAVAAELDPRYERFFAYLQDDLSRKRPTVGLILDLWCGSPEEKMGMRSRFAPEAPLMENGLVHLCVDTDQSHAPLLSHYVAPDEQVIHFLVGSLELDSRLTHLARWVYPASGPDDILLPQESKGALLALTARAMWENSPLRLYFGGHSGRGQRETVEGLAGGISLPLLKVDISPTEKTDQELSEIVRIAFTEAWVREAWLFISGIEALKAANPLALEALRSGLKAHSGFTVLSGNDIDVPETLRQSDIISLSFHLPDADLRKQRWLRRLEHAKATVDLETLSTLAERFQLNFPQIDHAVSDAMAQARWRLATEQHGGQKQEAPLTPTREELFAATRAQAGHGLAEMAQKIRPAAGWKDIVLPKDTLAQLKEICGRASNNRTVLGDWGFGEKLSQGKGLAVLFAGPSGTGKTMAAEVIARELGLDIYKIDLAGIVSKYIGETEKNLARLFEAAESSNAILFFDEADALFGKRSEVHDAHDRYANIETAYLLQKLEQYEGIAILATNLRANLDEAFSRRLAFTVQFPFPDDAQRKRIWEVIWPENAPLEEEIDFEFISKRFKLAGGNIKNAALAAAFLAAEDGETIRTAHLLQAIRREYQKMGQEIDMLEFAVVPLPSATKLD
jgi:DNA polymerase III delta prime subunit